MPISPDQTGTFPAPDEINPQRLLRYSLLCEHYNLNSDSSEICDDAPARYAAVSTDCHTPAVIGAISTWETLEKAFAALGDLILNGWAPDAAYDLDTGERIEIHIGTPAVTRSEDQGTMYNPLDQTERLDKKRREKIETLVRGYSGAHDDLESDLTDALADAMHLASSQDLDTRQILERATSHFKAETAS